MNNEICCPKFNSDGWDEKEIKWENKKFVVDSVSSFLHIPLNFGSVMKRNISMIESASAKPKAMIVLSDEGSLWGSNVYIEITRDVPDVKIAGISGTFLSKVFEGPYKDIGKWIKEMKDYAKAKGKEIKKQYFYYTACPKCAKVYGKNYVVLIAQI